MEVRMIAVLAGNPFRTYSEVLRACIQSFSPPFFLISYLVIFTKKIVKFPNPILKHGLSLQRYILK